MTLHEKAIATIDGLQDLVEQAESQYEVGNGMMAFPQCKRHILKDALDMLVTQDEILSCVEKMAKHIANSK